MSRVVDPEASAIYHMIACLREAGVDRSSGVFQTLLGLFAEIRKLEELATEAHERSDYWHQRALAAEGKLRVLTNARQKGYAKPHAKTKE
jgi:hypothetical protein